MRASTTEILSKVDDELSKEAVHPDLLEELVEQPLLIHDCLDKIDRGKRGTNKDRRLGG